MANMANMANTTVGSNLTFGVISNIVTAGSGLTMQTAGSTTFSGAITAPDVVIGGKSLSAMLDKMNSRLLILQPDLEKLEKYAALKAAYEQYTLLEAMIGNHCDD